MARISLDRVGVLTPDTSPDSQALAVVTQWLLADLCSPGQPVALAVALATPPEGVPAVRACLDAAYAAALRDCRAWGLAAVVGLHTGTMAVQGGARRHVHQAALYTDGAGAFAVPAFSEPFTGDAPPQRGDLERAVHGLSALRLKVAGVVAPSLRVYDAVRGGDTLAVLRDAALAGCVVARLADYTATLSVDVLVAPPDGHAWAGTLVPLLRQPLVCLAGDAECGLECLAGKRSALVVGAAADTVAAAAQLVRRNAPGIGVHGVALVRGAGPCAPAGLDSLHVMF